MGAMSHITLVCVFFLAFSLASAHFSPKVGVNYGQLGNNLPQPSESVRLMKSINVRRVRLYDANPAILESLKGTNIQVTVMVPNDLVSNISTNQTMANQWVETNILPFYPNTQIRYLIVSNELLSNMDPAVKMTWSHLVPAMRKMNYALKVHHIREVKVGTSMAIDVLDSAVFPPSNATFRSDISESIVRPMLKFLNHTKSFLFADCYPYFTWAANYQNLSLSYALFEGNKTYTDPGNGLTYTNLLDQMLDSFHFAMKKLGYPDIRIWLAETGWPNGGDIDQIGANVYNAAVYNRNLVKKLNAKPSSLGTPARPGVVLPTFIFALYNENQKGGPGTERHWGLFYPNGTNVYPIDLSGRTLASYSQPLPPPTNNEPYKGKIWCVAAKRPANLTELRAALTHACGQGNGTCDAIKPEGMCYKPNSVSSHASYAFSSYWAQMRRQGATCFFNGLAVQTTKDPSYGQCKYPSVVLP